MRNPLRRQKIQLSDHFDFPRLLRFTLPSILMMVITSVYSIVDGLFISNFAGSDGFAAVNLMMPIAMLISCLGFMAGAGGSALISKTFGEKRDDDAREQFSLIIYAIVLLSAAIGIIVFFLIPQIASRLGAKDAVYDNCLLYGRILIAALPAFMLQIVFQNFLVVAERPKLSMAIALSSGITNILLDALFVVVFRWGVAGAAAATVIGQMIGGVIPLGYFIARKNEKLWFTRVKRNPDTLKKTASNGLSALISNASAAVIGIVFNLKLMTLIGADGVVAYGVVMYISYIVTGVFMGYSTGISPVFSYHFGAGNSAENRSLLQKSLLFLAVASILLTGLVLAFANALSSVFVSYDAGLMALTTKALRLYIWSCLLCGFNIFAAALFAALNNGQISGILSFCRTMLFQLACVWILPDLFGDDWIWLSVTAAEALSFLTALLLVAKYRRQYFGSSPPSRRPV